MTVLRTLRLRDRKEGQTETPSPAFFTPSSWLRTSSVHSGEAPRTTPGHECRGCDLDVALGNSLPRALWALGRKYREGGARVWQGLTFELGRPVPTGATLGRALLEDYAVMWVDPMAERL